MRPVYWVGPSLDELREMPPEVNDEVGYALFVAQCGDKPDNATPLQGFGGAQVVEVKIDHGGNTYRVVYTTKFPEAIYVLCAFQKKSTRGRRTPQRQMDLVRTRLQHVEEAARKAE